MHVSMPGSRSRSPSPIKRSRSCSRKRSRSRARPINPQKNKKQISSIKHLISYAKDRAKRIETVTNRLAMFIDTKSASYLETVFFGEYSLMDKSGFFRGAD